MRTSAILLPRPTVPDVDVTSARKHAKKVVGSLTECARNQAHECLPLL